MTTFAKRLTDWRDAQQWTNAALAEHLSAGLGIEISPRSLENWIQGREPDKLWRRQIESLLPRTETINER